MLNLTVPDFEHADDATLRRLLKSYVIQMNKKLDSVLSSLDTENFTDDLAALLNSVVSADDLSTAIQQTNDAIALRATQTGVNALGERVTTAEASLLLKASLIELMTRAIAYSGATPPDAPDVGKRWEYTGVTPYELLKWTGKGTSTARRYAASASGASVTISDISDDHALDVTAKTVATQAGSGTPSPTNVRAISGRSAATVRRVGKNAFRLVPSQTVNGITITVNPLGSVTLNGTATANAFFSATMLSALSGVLVLSAGNAAANPGVIIRAVTATGTIVLDLPLSSANAVSAPFSGDVWQATIRVASGTVLSNFNFRPQLEIGSAATGFEKYAETDYTLTPDTALYGLTGYEDEIGNDGQVTHKTEFLSLAGTEAWEYPSTQPTLTTLARFLLQHAGMANSPAGIASHFPHQPAESAAYTYEVVTGHSSGSNISVYILKSRMSGWSDAWTSAQKIAAFKAWLAARVTAGAPLQVLFQRATAFAAAVSETEIAGLDGDFTVSSNGASVAVEYTGSGWAYVGATTRFESSAVSITPEGGIRVDQRLPGNVAVPFYARIGAKQFGVYRVSDDAAVMEAGADADGVGYMAVNRLRDPQINAFAFMSVFGEVIGEDYSVMHVAGLKFMDALHAEFDGNGTPIYTAGSAVERGRMGFDTNTNTPAKWFLSWGGSLLSMFENGLRISAIDQDSPADVPMLTMLDGAGEGMGSYAPGMQMRLGNYSSDAGEITAPDTDPIFEARNRQYESESDSRVRRDGGVRVAQTYTDLSYYTSRYSVSTVYNSGAMYQGWYTGIGTDSLGGRYLFNVPSGGVELTGKYVTRIQFGLTCASVGTTANKTLKIYDTNFPTTKSVGTTTGAQFTRNLLGTITGRFYGNTVTVDMLIDVYGNTTVSIVDSSGLSTPTASADLFTNLRTWFQSGGRTLAIYNGETARGTESANYSNNYLGITAWTATITYSDVEPYTMRSIGVRVGVGATLAEITATNGPGRGQLNTIGDFVPRTTNTDTLGNSTYRYKNAYLVTGPSVSSDERLKRNILDLDAGLGMVLALKPIEYRMIFDPEDAPKHMGFRAQQVREVMADMGMGARALVDESNPDQLALVYHELIAPLVGAVQAQQRQIDALTARVEALEARGAE